MTHSITTYIAALVERAEKSVTTEWLQSLGLPLSEHDARSLLQRASSERNAVPDFVLYALARAHQDGDADAGTVAIALCIRSIRRVSNYSRETTPEAKFHDSLCAFMESMARVNSVEKCISNLHFRALEHITRGNRSTSVAAFTTDEIDTVDATSFAFDDIDAYLTVEALLAFGVNTGVVSEGDAHALRIAHCGSKKVPVREVARQLSMAEDKLETRLRRAKRALGKLVIAQRDELTMFVRSYSHSAGPGGTIGATSELRADAA